MLPALGGHRLADIRRRDVQDLVETLIAEDYNRRMVNVAGLREERTRRIREAHTAGLSTTAIAEIFGLSQQYVSRLVLGS